MPLRVFSPHSPSLLYISHNLPSLPLLVLAIGIPTQKAQTSARLMIAYKEGRYLSAPELSD